MNGLYKLTTKFLNAQKLYVRKFQLNICKNNLLLECRNLESMNFLEHYFLIGNVSVKLQYNNYKESDINLLDFSITLTGLVEFNGKYYNIQIERRRTMKDNNIFEISITGKNIYLEDIFSTFRIENIFFDNICPVIDQNHIRDIQITDFTIKGIYKNNDGFYLIVSGYFQKSNSIIEPNIEIVIDRHRQKPVTAALVLKGKLDQLILPFLEQALLNKKRHIPIVDKKVDLGILTISGRKISRGSYDFEHDLKVIPKGIILQTISAFQELNKRSNDKKYTNSTRLIPTQLEICQKRDSVEFNPDADINLIDFLEKFDNQDVPIVFPDWLMSDDTVVAQIKKVDYSGSSRNIITVKALIIASFTILFDFVTLEKVEIELLFDKDNTENGWNCGQLKQKQKLLTYEADLILTCDEQLKNIRIILNIACFGFESLLEILKVNVIPDPLKEALKKITEFQIKDFRLETTKGGDEFMRILGSPLLFGLNTFTLEAMTWVEDGNKKFALGIVLKDLQLAELLEKMIGKKLTISWIGEMKAAIIISNTKLESKEKRIKIEQQQLKTNRERKKRSSISTKKYNPYAFSPLSQNYNLQKFGSLQTYHPNMLHPLTKNHLLGKYHAGVKTELPSNIFGVTSVTQNFQRTTAQPFLSFQNQNPLNHKQLTKDSIEKASILPKNVNTPKPLVYTQLHNLTQSREQYSKWFSRTATELNNLQHRVEETKEKQDRMQNMSYVIPQNTQQLTQTSNSPEGYPPAFARPYQESSYASVVPSVKSTHVNEISFETEIKNVSPGSLIQSQTNLEIPHQNPDITSSIHLETGSPASMQLKHLVPVVKNNAIKPSAKMIVPLRKINQKSGEKILNPMNPYQIPVQDFMFIATSPKSSKKSINNYNMKPPSSNASLNMPYGWAYYYNKYRQLKTNAQNAISRSNFSLSNPPTVFSFATAGMFPQIFYNQLATTGSKRSDPTQMKNLETFEDDMSALYGEKGIKRMPLDLSKGKSAIDNLLEAYNKNNRDKSLYNYDYQKNLNSGIIDGEDKRSKIAIPFNTLEDFEKYLQTRLKLSHKKSKKRKNKKRKGDEFIDKYGLKDKFQQTEEISENILNGLIANEESNGLENIDKGIIEELNTRKQENAVQSNVLKYGTKASEKPDRPKHKITKKGTSSKSVKHGRQVKIKKRKSVKKHKLKQKKHYIDINAAKRSSFNGLNSLFHAKSQNTVPNKDIQKFFPNFPGHKKTIKSTLKQIFFKINPNQKFYFSNNNFKPTVNTEQVFSKEKATDVTGVSRGSVAFIPETSEEVFNLYKEKIPYKSFSNSSDDYIQGFNTLDRPVKNELYFKDLEKPIISKLNRSLLENVHHKTPQDESQQYLSSKTKIAHMKDNMTRHTVTLQDFNITKDDNKQLEEISTLKDFLHKTQELDISDKDFIKLLNENSNTNSKHQIYFLEKHIDKNNLTNYKIKTLHQNQTKVNNINKTKELYKLHDNTSSTNLLFNSINKNKTGKSTQVHKTRAYTQNQNQSIFNNNITQHVGKTDKFFLQESKYKNDSAAIKDHTQMQLRNISTQSHNRTDELKRSHDKLHNMTDESKISKLNNSNDTRKNNSTKLSDQLHKHSHNKIHVLTANLKIVPVKNREIQLKFDLNLNKSDTFENKSSSDELLTDENNIEAESFYNNLIKNSDNLSISNISNTNLSHQDSSENLKTARKFPTSTMIHKSFYEDKEKSALNFTNDFSDRDIEESADILEDASKSFNFNRSLNHNKFNETPSIHLNIGKTDFTIKNNSFSPTKSEITKIVTTRNSIADKESKVLNDDDDKEDIIVVSKPAVNKKITTNSTHNNTDNIFHLNITDLINEIDQFGEQTKTINTPSHILKDILNVTKSGKSKQILLKFDIDDPSYLEQRIEKMNKNLTENKDNSTTDLVNKNITAAVTNVSSLQSENNINKENINLRNTTFSNNTLTTSNSSSKIPSTKPTTFHTKRMTSSKKMTSSKGKTTGRPLSKNKTSENSKTSLQLNNKKFRHVEEVGHKLNDSYNNNTASSFNELSDDEDMNSEKGVNVFGDMDEDNADSNVGIHSPSHFMNSTLSKDHSESAVDDTSNSESDLLYGQLSSGIPQELHKHIGKAVNYDSATVDKPEIELEEDDINKDILNLIDKQANPQTILNLVEKKYDDEGNARYQRKDKTSEISNQKNSKLGFSTLKNTANSEKFRHPKAEIISKISAENEHEEKAVKHFKSKSEDAVTRQLLKGIDSMLTEGLPGTATPKTIMLKNKKLKLLMEVRHDGDAKGISVETEGLEHLYDDRNKRKQLKLQKKTRNFKPQHRSNKGQQQKINTNKSKKLLKPKKKRKEVREKLKLIALFDNKTSLTSQPSEKKANETTNNQSKDDNLIDDSLLNPIIRSKEIENVLHNQQTHKTVVHLSNISGNIQVNTQNTSNISSSMIQPTKDDFLYEREIIHNNTVSKLDDIIEYFHKKHINQKTINALKRMFIQHAQNISNVTTETSNNASKRMELFSPLNQAIIKIDSDDIGGDIGGDIDPDESDEDIFNNTEDRNDMQFSDSSDNSFLPENESKESDLFSDLAKKSLQNEVRHQKKGLEIKGINDISVGYYGDSSIIPKQNNFMDASKMVDYQREHEQDINLKDNPNNYSPFLSSDMSSTNSENPLLSNSENPLLSKVYGLQGRNNNDIDIPSANQLADVPNEISPNQVLTGASTTNVKNPFFQPFLMQRDSPISNPNMFPMINDIKGNSPYAQHNVLQRVLPPNMQQLVASDQLIENERKRINKENSEALEEENLRESKEKQFFQNMANIANIANSRSEGNNLNGLTDIRGDKRNAIPIINQNVNDFGQDLVASDEISKNKNIQEFDYKGLIKKKNMKRTRLNFIKKSHKPIKNSKRKVKKKVLNKQKKHVNQSMRNKQKHKKAKVKVLKHSMQSNERFKLRNASKSKNKITIQGNKIRHISNYKNRPTKREFVEPFHLLNFNQPLKLNPSNSSMESIANRLNGNHKINLDEENNEILNLFSTSRDFSSNPRHSGSLLELKEKMIGKELIGTTKKGKSKNLEYGTELTKANSNQEDEKSRKAQLNFKSKAQVNSKYVGPETIKLVSKMNKKNAEKNVSLELLDQYSSIFDKPDDVSGKPLSVALMKPEKQQQVMRELKISNKTKNESHPLVEKHNAKNFLMTRDKGTSTESCKKCFLTNELSTMEVDEGVALDVEFSLPSECDNDKICEFIKGKLDGDSSLKITGLFTAAGIKMTLSYPGKTELTENIALEDIKLAMNIEGADSNIFISVILILEDPPLKFTGKIQISATGKLEFDMKMDGMWMKAFGVETVAIGNAILKISYLPGAPMPGFELGGQLMFGVLGTGKEIKAKLFFGFDPADPTGNYFYAKVDKLTVDGLMQAFNKSISLPGAVKESGFPKGLVIAFTSNPDGIEIPNEKIKIQFGFMLSGTINLLGYEGDCKIKITTEEILIDIKMAPMEFAGGIINFHKSSDDPSNGPIFKMKIGKSDLLIQAEGAVCMLGIQAEAKLLITTTVFKMEMKANLFDLLEGNILLEAGSDSEGGSPKFHLEACLSIKIEKLMEAITNKLNEIAEAAKKTIQRARDKVAETKELYEKAKSKIEEKEAKIEAKEAEINGDTRTILNHKDVLKRNCESNCPVVCHGDYIDSKQCSRAFNGWISCRKYVPCVKKTLDVACIAKCEKEKLLKRGFGGLAKMKAKMKLAKLKIMKVALKVAKQILKVAKIPFLLADTLLKAIEKLVSIGIEIAQSMVKSALEDIFQFHHFCISADLGGESDGLCVGFNMSVSLFKKEISLSGDLCINGKMFDSVGDSAVDDQYPEAKQMGDDLNEKEKDFQKLDEESEKAKNEAKKEDDKETMEKEMRDYIPSPIERYYESIVYEPDVSFDEHSDILSTIYDKQYKNLLSSELDVASGNISASNTNDQLLSNSSTGGCGNLSRTIYSYNEIANSLATILKRQHEEVKHHNALVEHFKSMIDEPGETYANNMTEDGYEKYQQYIQRLKRSYDSWYNLTSSQLEDRQKNVISKFINELYEILQHGDVSEFRKYMKSLHLQAESDVQKRTDVMQKPTEERNLRAIKMGFHKLLFKSDMTSLKEKIDDVEKLKSKLELAQTFSKLCDITE